MVTFTVIGGISRETSVTSEMSSFEDMLTLHYLEYLGGVVWQAVGYINLKLTEEVLATDIDLSGIIIYIVIKTKRMAVTGLLGTAVRNTETVLLSPHFAFLL